MQRVFELPTGLPHATIRGGPQRLQVRNVDALFQRLHELVPLIEP